MTSCFAWMILLAFAIFCMASLIRWFEQVTEAVDQGVWKKVLTLVAIPLTVWLYPSRVSAGRPTAVPHHEPVRGRGSAPMMPKEARKNVGLPMPPAKKKRPPVDPELIAKLKQKMKDQGMLEEKDDG